MVFEALCYSALLPSRMTAGAGVPAVATASGRP
jgi:hypothetical protein